MFFNSMFDEPSMFYQPIRRPCIRRPTRTVYRGRRPNTNVFGFPDFMGGLNDSFEIPIRMVDESEPRNLKSLDCENPDSNVQDAKFQDAKFVASELKQSEIENSENEDSENEVSEIEDSEIEDSDIEDSEIEYPEIEESNIETSKNGETSNTQEANSNHNSEQKSPNHALLSDILKTSENIENDLEDNLDSLDLKKATKKLKYAAENLYKLLEKLDMIHTADSDEKLLRKTAVKSIQKRLESTDLKLAELEN